MTNPILGCAPAFAPSLLYSPTVGGVQKFAGCKFIGKISNLLKIDKQHTHDSQHSSKYAGDGAVAEAKR
jgi:hypothetical protein